MKTWEECCTEVGYNPNDPTPIKQYVYYGYKNGVGREFATMELAIAFSRITERVVDKFSERVYDAYWADRHIAENKAHDVWYTELEQEFNYVNKELFSLCYDKAYDDNHSNGRDSVFSKMEEYIDFAVKIELIYSKGSI